MKIALLGTMRSGKSVYFSALYHKFRNVIAPPTLTRSRRIVYEQKGISTQVGFRLRIEDTKLDQKIAANAELLTFRPVRWPGPTDDLTQANISIQFDFVPIQASPASDVRQYKREIEFCDPTGGALNGSHREAEEILEKLRLCDAAIAFLPADVILDAMDTDNPEEIDDDQKAQINAGFLLGKVTEVMKQMNKSLDGNDVFPVCFVITKFDLIPKNTLPYVSAFIFNHIILPFSKDNKRFLVCVCPVSVVDPETGNFKSLNLEWPFLFAAQSTIVRNMNILKAQANRDFRFSTYDRDMADRLSNNWLSQCLHFISEGGETVGDLRRSSDNYLNSGHRKMGLANDDKALAEDILSSIAAEKQDRGIRILMAGLETDL